MKEADVPTYKNKHTGDIHETDKPHKRLEKSDRWVKLTATEAKREGDDDSEG